MVENGKKWIKMVEYGLKWLQRLKTVETVETV